MPACKKFWARRRNEKWTDEDRTEVVSLYNWVKKAFLAHGGARLQCTVGDVLLLLLRVVNGGLNHLLALVKNLLHRFEQKLPQNKKTAPKPKSA